MGCHLSMPDAIFGSVMEILLSRYCLERLGEEGQQGTKERP